MKRFLATTLLVATQGFAEEPTYDFEIGFHNGFLFSQEFASDIFADFNSRIRPTPAYILMLDGEVRLSERLNTLTMITIPTREEIVQREGQDPWVYYYPKALLGGVEYDVFPVAFGRHRREVENRLGFGLNIPLSKRFGRLLIPVFSYRMRIQTSENAGMFLGAGYSGNIMRGLWFVPFGFSYRL